MTELLKVFQGANPAMIFVMGLMLIFSLLLALSWIAGFVAWLCNSKDTQCGWGCWYNDNDSSNHGYCDRRAYHLGEHHGPHTWEFHRHREWRLRQQKAALEVKP